MSFRVSIDPETRVGCDACVKSCAYGVLGMIDDLAYLVEPGNCKGCKDRIEACEVKAISVIHI